MKMRLLHHSPFVSLASGLPVLRLGFWPFHLGGALFGGRRRALDHLDICG